MIIDTSALLAILLRESGYEVVLDVARRADVRMSVATYVELNVVIDRRGKVGDRERLDRVLELLGIELVPVSLEQGRVACAAHRRYGPGSGSAARLNYGDCFSYALAETLGEPLLFVGNDFSHTDVEQAIEDPR
ncbi:MAG: type II toxin-antitoxin system VapC family toxin [Propionibacteriaceae bacterium]|nr:type II toxin-antitoxin system VapC family toxin [Propionibacteriaceae bacterium]